MPGTASSTKPMVASCDSTSLMSLPSMSAASKMTVSVVGVADAVAVFDAVAVGVDESVTVGEVDGVGEVRPEIIATKIATAVTAKSEITAIPGQTIGLASTPGNGDVSVLITVVAVFST